MEGQQSCSTAQSCSLFSTVLVVIWNTRERHAQVSMHACVLLLSKMIEVLLFSTLPAVVRGARFVVCVWGGLPACRHSTLFLSSKPTAVLRWVQNAHLLEKRSALPCWTPARCWTWNEKSCSVRNHLVTLLFVSLVWAILCKGAWSVTRVKCQPAR